MRIVAAMLLLLVATAGADAQRPGARPRQQRPGEPGRPEGQAPREELEANVRRVFARVVRERVGLNDEQMQKLGPMNEGHALARRRLQLDERALRAQLQVELVKDAPSDTAVSRMLNQFIDIQKRRAQLMETEQKELATIMTPVQRARFNALQEQVRRQLDERREPPPAGGAAPNRFPGRRRPPPG